MDGKELMTAAPATIEPSDSVRDALTHGRARVAAAVVLLLVGGCSDRSPSDPSMGASTSTGPAPDGSSEGQSTTSEGADSSTGGPIDGYPPAVLDALELPWPPYDYDPPLPAHFNTPAVLALDNTPAGNAITDPGATLGRVLFYDVALSLNETIACASCHPQAHGFADPLELSGGFEGGPTARNSMGLINSRFYASGRFFWDERAETLEDQVLRPIQDPVEMGMTLELLVTRLEQRAYYPFLFEQAFGDPTIDPERISWALAQFVRSITSYRSAYDEGLAEVGGNPLLDFPSFTAQQNLGKQVFFGVGNCAPCHLGQSGEPLPPGTPPPNAAIFMIVGPLNNGLEASLVGEDNGVGDELDDIAFNGMFKSPSLRNAELTGPYMHDGRFATLTHVIQHYDSGVLPHPNLDARLEDPMGQPQRLNMQTAEKQALQVFLGTLTDTALVEDRRFADPFRG